MEEDKSPKESPKTEEMTKEALKKNFMMQLYGAANDLIKKVVNAKNLLIAIVLWTTLSLVLSFYRRLSDTCQNITPVDTYLAGHMLCLEKRQ